MNKTTLSKLDRLNSRISACVACPRLVAWRQKVAAQKRASFGDQDYWGKPVSGFGDYKATLVVVGLAPAAHGANRTGRMFTGDSSGDWLLKAMWKAGYANQPVSKSIDDGLLLKSAWVTAALRCAPPANKPTVLERDTCLAYLEEEFGLLQNMRVVIALGNFAYGVLKKLFSLSGVPKFAHGLEVPIPSFSKVRLSAVRKGGGDADYTRGGDSSGDNFVNHTLLCSYHPSQQNTFTKKLTEPDFQAIFDRAKELGA
ncbi:MAG: uracil-DNA glycosylase [Actinobacteria bacterium]|nr:uracil-DNA glycosylase [Actinomycetota bacterium]MCL6104741.1 uracil-DNA glycosylase [Actinomycetota bacterium]